MTAPIKVSTPSVDVQGLSFVQVANGVTVNYRNASGDLSEAAIRFYDDGAGIAVFLSPLPAGTVFSTDTNGLVRVTT